MCARMYKCVHVCAKEGITHRWQVRAWPEVLRIILKALFYTVWKQGVGTDDLSGPPMPGIFAKDPGGPQGLEQERSWKEG